MKGIRFWGLLALTLTVASIVGTKAMNEGWFVRGPGRDFNGQPALVFFTLSRGCQCQMQVMRSAERQIENWTDTERRRLPVLRVDLVLRRDLGERFGVYRASALLLVDADERVIWRQDVGVSDEAPLDLS